MDGKLIFTKVNGQSGGFFLKRDRLTAASLFQETEKVTGGIYIARVRDVVNSLNACFVEIQKDKVCFLPGREMQSFCLLNPGASDTVGKRSLRQGDLVLVQGIREAQKTKQPSVTAAISVSNRYFVLTLGSNRTGFSAKLSKERKQQLGRILEKLPYFDERGCLKPLRQLKEENFEILKAVPDAGLIVRTQCETADDRELESALKQLTESFLELVVSAFYRSAYTCLKTPPKPWQEAFANLILPGECEELLTDDEELYREMSACGELPPGVRLRLYEDKTYPLEKLYSLHTKLKEALGTHIWLKSGAYLVIEPTEALTVIDVNSGKFEAHRGDQEFVRSVNLEAAAEIARQIRLRNLSGMILIDFINLTTEEECRELLDRMRKAVSEDRVKTNVIDFTRLGLMEITRQRRDPPLAEQAKAYRF